MIIKIFLTSLLFSFDFYKEKSFIQNENFSKKNKLSVIVLTETQGFVHHAAIKEGVKLITKLGEKNNFNVTHTNNSKHLTNRALKKSDVLIFLCTTLDVLNKKEEERMKNFIKNGKGYVGVHSATDTEYDWGWYGKLVGAYFLDHPKIQQARITTIDNSHISTRHLEKSWKIEDEWYNFKDFNPSINELLNLEESSYDGGKNGEYHPITWYHEFGGGRSFYTGLGHRGEIYHDERFIKLLLGGILYAAGN
jgi:type 1 glutamine amidotransferase